MILTSGHILNDITEPNQYKIAPNIHNFCNTVNEQEIYEEIAFPDICPGQHIPEGVQFSMATGEFLRVYEDSMEDWDAMVTCFFIDTAHNILEYIEKIWIMLKPGAVWVNIGPLLYHYSDN